MPVVWEEEHLDPQYIASVPSMPFQKGFMIGLGLINLDFDPTLADFMIFHYDLEANVNSNR